MVCYGEFCALTARMEKAISALDIEWKDDMTLTNARLFHEPEKPFLDSSKSVMEGLQYLQSELNCVNLRFQTLVRWKAASGNGRTSFDLQNLINDLAVRPIGAESYTWMLKRTLSVIEHFLENVSELLEGLENLVTQKIDNLKDSIADGRCFVDQPGLAECFKIYEEAENEHILERVGDTLVDAVAKIQNENNWHELEPDMLVKIVSVLWNNHLKTAEDLAEMGMPLPRQRLITEFF